MRPDVHVLHHGRALCTTRPSFPAEWPDGERWVPLDQHRYATCVLCVAEAGRILAAEERTRLLSMARPTNETSEP